MAQLLPVYEFRLVPNSNYMSISHHLGVVATEKVSCVLSLRPKFWTPTATLTPGQFFFKTEWFPPWIMWIRGKASTKNEVDRFNIF